MGATNMLAMMIKTEVRWMKNRYDDDDEDYQENYCNDNNYYDDNNDGDTRFVPSTPSNVQYFMLLQQWSQGGSTSHELPIRHYNC